MLHQVRIQHCLPFDVVAFNSTAKPKTLALIDRIESGEEKLYGPFDTKEDLWRSLEI